MAHRVCHLSTTKEDYPSSVIHNHINLASPAQEMAKDPKNVKAEYAFSAASLQKDWERKPRSGR